MEKFDTRQLALCQRDDDIDGEGARQRRLEYLLDRPEEELPLFSSGRHRLSWSVDQLQNDPALAKVARSTPRHLGKHRYVYLYGYVSAPGSSAMAASALGLLRRSYYSAQGHGIATRDLGCGAARDVSALCEEMLVARTRGKPAVPQANPAMQPMYLVVLPCGTNGCSTNQHPPP
jgi:hypothetical protein